jgi:hypothetical protein
MSNPTTPFGWQMPTATDLVTDLPADFEVFGQAVATSMADLLGGTSGQILAKNSNTDMDFVWIANDQGDITAVTAGTGISGGGTSGAVTITNSMATAIDAKGDLIVGTGADTFARLAVGTNNLVVTSDSTTSTGLKYSQDWTAYTPSWGSTGTQPAIGNGTLQASYLRVGKLVYVHIYWKAGSTTTYGTGIYFFSLPFSAYTFGVGSWGFPTSGYLENSGIAGYTIQGSSTSGSNFVPILANGNSWSGTDPFTLGTDDFVNIQLVYGVA